MATDSNSRSGDGVQVIARAAEIMRHLEDAPAGLTQAEIGERLNLARSTVHRILAALEAEGLVRTAGRRGRYRIGPRMARMADAAKSAVIAEINPHLHDLSRRVNESVDLSILDRDCATFVDQVVAPQRLRAVSTVGASFPLYCTANGKALLAALSVNDVRALLPDRFPAQTPYSITELSVLQEDLAIVRREGIAYDRQEHTEGICAVGAVVLGTPLGIAAVSIPMPATRFPGREEDLCDALGDTVTLIGNAFAPSNESIG